MVGKSTNDFFTASIPDTDLVVIITTKEVATRGGEVDGGDAGGDISGVEALDILTGADIPEEDVGIIGASGEGVAAGEEGNRVDVALVTAEGHDVFAVTHIPEFGGGVASTRDKSILVGREGNSDDVTNMTDEFLELVACLDVPFHASLIARACEELVVGFESAAREEAVVSSQLLGGVALSEVAEVEERAAVVETTGSDPLTRRRICTGHDPGRAERDGVDLVGGGTMPDDEFSILSGGNKM